MAVIDTTATLRDIYGARLDLHLDLNRRSEEHRLEHNDAGADASETSDCDGLLVSDNLFSLFSDWAQGMGGSDAVKRYLTDLVSDPRFVTHIFQGKWEAWSYRLQPAAAPR